MQHPFASIINLNGTFVLWKKLNTVRDLEEIGSFSKKSHATSVCVDNALCLSNLQWRISSFCGKSWNVKFNSDKLLNWQFFFSRNDMKANDINTEYHRVKISYLWTRKVFPRVNDFYHSVFISSKNLLANFGCEYTSFGKK